MNINLKPLWDNLSGQALIALAIVALVIIVAGVLTQGFARTIGAVAGVFILAGIIIALGNIQSIAQFVKNHIFGGGAIVPEQLLNMLACIRWW